MGKFTLIFLLATIFCIMGYGTIWWVMNSNIFATIFLSMFLLPLSWGILIFGIATIVCFLLKI